MYLIVFLFLFLCYTQQQHKALYYIGWDVLMVLILFIYLLHKAPHAH